MKTLTHGRRADGGASAALLLMTAALLALSCFVIGAVLPFIVGV